VEQTIKVLVAGGGGFIGSHLASYLKDKGYFVRVVDIHFPQIRKEWWSKADEVVNLDMRDYVNVIKVTRDIDWVCWLCSDMGGVGYFSTHDYYPYLNNMTMDMNILKACEFNGVKRLFYSSSACIYPTHLQQDPSKPLMLKEDMIFPANSDLMYGWEKLMMTMLCERSPLDARVGIFHTIYGEGQEWDGERAKFPPSITRKVLEADKVVKLWGDGQQIRTYLFIDDAVEKIYRILTMPYSGPVNVGADEITSVRDTAKLLCEIAGKECTFEFENDKPSGVLGRGVDNSEFIRRYGYHNQYSLRDGFTRMYNWLKGIVK